ncbi:MAG TPA: hypothetical protein VMI72_04510 [Roseiarcus sp.]|nr:hypothetical protein [Roseiarcus sp.]
MSAVPAKKVSVSQLFTQQVVVNFVVVALLIALGALLVFKVYAEQYTSATALGFIAAVYFSFIVFLPAGTLFASRAEFAKGKVVVEESEKTGATAPIPDPLMHTAPLGVAFAAAATALAWAVIYGFGWTPSPPAATLTAMLFVIPYAVIVRLNIFRDLEGLAATGPFHGKKVASKTGHVWATYVIPNLVFQSIINLPLAYRGFWQAAAAIADRAGPGMVPAQALAPDFAITFMFVCSFTFLAVVTHTASDMYEGEFGYDGHARGINGFLYFGLLLLMGLGLGVAVAALTQVLGVQVVAFPVAMVMKFLVVFLAVWVACRLGVGWTGKKFNDAMRLAA